MLLRTDAFTHRRFYTDAFTHRRFYTETLLHTDALHKDAFTHLHKGTQAQLHTEPFTQRTQNSFYTKTLLRRKPLTQKNCPHRLHKEVFTHRNFHMQKLCPEQLLHTETFPHRNLYAQKSLCTSVFTLTLLPTDALTQKNFYTQKLLHTALHTASFYTERLCFPFFMT